MAWGFSYIKNIKGRVLEMRKLSLRLSKLQKLHNEYCQPKHVISFGGFNTPKNNEWLEQLAFTTVVFKGDESYERIKMYKLYRNDKVKGRFRDCTKIRVKVLKFINLFNINIYCLR